MKASAKHLHVRPIEKEARFSQAVRDGARIVMSGCVSWDGDAAPLPLTDLRSQLHHIYFTEIDGLLEKLGVRRGDVIKETIFTVDMEALKAAADVRATYYEGLDGPATTWVEVRRLFHPEFLVEVEIEISV